VNEDDYVYLARCNMEQIHSRKRTIKERKSIPRARGLDLEYNYKSSIVRIRMWCKLVQMKKARRMEQWVKDILTITVELMTANNLSEEVKVKEKRMILMDDNPIKVIKKPTRKRAYYGAVINRSGPKSLPFIRHNKTRKLQKRLKSGGR
jgi:hypothetical protein